MVLLIFGGFWRILADFSDFLKTLQTCEFDAVFVETRGRAAWAASAGGHGCGTRGSGRAPLALALWPAEPWVARSVARPQRRASSCARGRLSIFLGFHGFSRIFKVFHGLSQKITEDFTPTTTKSCSGREPKCELQIRRAESECFTTVIDLPRNSFASGVALAPLAARKREP